MKLWRIYFQYGEHEEESEVFAHSDAPRPSTEDARKYLLAVYATDDGYMQDALEHPGLLTVAAVYEFTTVNDIDGNPYKVGVIE